MATAEVYYNEMLAGCLEKRGAADYCFSYDPHYLLDPGSPSISLTLPKSGEVFRSARLFPFFTGMLAEGINKDIQCRLLKIDEQDDFTRLLKTGGTDSIGAIAIKEIEE